MSAHFPGRHRRVLVDTNVWIYHFEQHAEFGPASGRILDAIEQAKAHGVTSELVLLELLVRPLALRRQDVADEYELMLRNFPNLELIAVDRSILATAATLRARYRIRTPDAIQLATGIAAGATLAVTNDATWRRADGIDILLVSEGVR